jgi:hypothetical protein
MKPGAALSLIGLRWVKIGVPDSSSGNLEVGRPRSGRWAGGPALISRRVTTRACRAKLLKPLTLPTGIEGRLQKPR